jgi:acetyl esterase/lipase
VKYGPVPDFQTLDLFLPENTDQSVPLVIWIHGGAWRAGDKENHPGGALIEAGFAVASINYRLSTVSPYPAQFQDCQAAVRYLRTNAEKYGIDGNRIGVWGGSAGGHLAAMLGVHSNSRNKAFRVQAVCDWCGPTDLVRAITDTPKDSPLNIVEVLWELFLGPAANNQKLKQSISLAQRTRLLAGASPINHVTRNCPPFLVMHGDTDNIVPIIQSERFVEVLRAAKVKVDYRPISGAGHGFRDRPECIADVVAFFQKHLANAQDE